jgi:hypothetical protein
MRYFLLVYDRRLGRLIDEVEFDDEKDALSSRFARERAERATPDDVEIVVLGAQSRSALERTHARYFKSPSELLTQSR